MKNSYKDSLLQTATSLDAVLKANGEISRLAYEIVENYDNNSLIELYKRSVTVIEDTSKSKEARTIAISLKEALFSYMGFHHMRAICEERKTKLQQDEDEPLEVLIEELNALVGLDNVKREVNDLIAFQKVQALRGKIGLYSAKGTLHMAFTGNPGTGKTTVARIVGKMYKQLGLLSKGHFLEVSRTDLIAGYQGQTALKVKNVIETIKGGVLFIDEAYSITENDHADSYGRECLTELTKALEDYRDDLVVIVAGYSEPMKKFFDSNPGLKSRFNKFIDFNDYCADELLEIFQGMCAKNQYMLSDDALAAISGYIAKCVSEKDENFSNGRFARNLYDDLIMNQARRVAQIKSPTRNDLMMITLEDTMGYNSESFNE